MVDCTLTASLDLDRGRRLSDLLNGIATVTLYDLTLYALADGREVRAAQFEVDVGELYAVEALDKPETARHMHTRSTRVEVELGPYRIVGQVHGPVGADPAHTVIRRKPMIPLTHATIEYDFLGDRVVVDSDVVIFNRSVARGVRPVDQLSPPDDNDAGADSDHSSQQP